ncbi:MAG TPA: hypothetical protein VGC60_10185, partial [Pyrinomonadaceae bacterium]
MSKKRFRIAFSFAGEKRDFVSKVAAILAERFGEEKILYDKYHEAEFARYDLGIYLPKLYRDESDLIVAVLCKDYDQKEWAGWEWMAIHAQLTKRQGSHIMLTRFDRAHVDGLFDAAAFVELDDKTPGQAARLILQRLAINEGKPKNHFSDAQIPDDTPSKAMPNRTDGPRVIGDAFDRQAGSPVDDAYRVARYLHDHKFLGPKSIRVAELRTNIGLSADDFDAADFYLLNSKFCGGTMGENGMRWLTSSGVPFARAIERPKAKEKLTAKDEGETPSIDNADRLYAQV